MPRVGVPGRAPIDLGFERRRAVQMPGRDGASRGIRTAGPHAGRSWDRPGLAGWVAPPLRTRLPRRPALGKASAGFGGVDGGQHVVRLWTFGALPALAAPRDGGRTTLFRPSVTVRATPAGRAPSWASPIVPELAARVIHKVSSVALADRWSSAVRAASDGEGQARPEWLVDLRASSSAPRLVIVSGTVARVARSAARAAPTPRPTR